MDRLKLIEDLVNDKTVIDALESNNHLNLAKFIGRQFCSFNEHDEKYIDLFWNSAFNQSWIYLSDEIVHEQFGYKKSKDMLTHFYKKLIDEFEKEIDYKQVDKENELVAVGSQIIASQIDKRSSHNKKYFIITGETFKELLQLAQTDRGKLTRKYFIKVEALGNITTKLIFKYADQTKQKQLDEKNKQLDKALERNTCLHTINAELLSYKKLLSLEETIYIVSTKMYAEQGLYKIGRTKNVKTRNSNNNVIHVKGDKVKILAEFKVNNSTLMESIIHKKLEGLRPDKNSEFFMCPYDLLIDITEMLVNFDHEENESVNKIIETVYKIKQHNFILADWTSGLNMEIFNESMRLVDGNGTDAKEFAKFDTTNATEEQKQAFVRECIAGYYRTILPTEQIQNATIIITWKAFQGFLIQRLLKPKSN